ncbi:glycosyltransferase family 2 protein [Gloeocapsa sp. PCC 73106]|uniref:glycosyltransferase family 2 protein n=1 Tax=Gloeocapsa sp. PCC 73106 TaxID=102232 RepID=UPI0002AC721B|nr:glycosyltransferase [Gloeocapsa sp. PCC 73106]ELR99920.1 putative glycosyltransferase [Gloeocapsa sp. PCC 73106]
MQNEQPSVTIVVVPRERFSFSGESLNSIYENTQYPFDLIYVDGNSPKNVKEYLQQQASEKNFQLLRTEKYLAPNQARNLSLKHVKTEYLVFIDNDVYVEPDWLTKLINCAEETGATVVCPLVCIGQERYTKVHLAGGEARIILEFKNDKVRRKVHEKHYFVNRLVSEVKEQLRRRQCEFAEFHCMLVRNDIFEQIPQLDENLLSTREHIDFSLAVTDLGKTIYCEPEAVVTYVPPRRLAWSDLRYFMLRWSDRWEKASIEYFAQKWQLRTKDKYFQKRYDRLGYRRHQVLLKPIVRFLSFGGYNTWLYKLLVSGERKLNNYLTQDYKSLDLPSPLKVKPDSKITVNS